MKNQLTNTRASRQEELRPSLSPLLHSRIILIQRIRLYMAKHVVVAAERTFPFATAHQALTPYVIAVCTSIY